MYPVGNITDFISQSGKLQLNKSFESVELDALKSRDIKELTFVTSLNVKSPVCNLLMF